MKAALLRSNVDDLIVIRIRCMGRRESQFELTIRVTSGESHVSVPHRITRLSCSAVRLVGVPEHCIRTIRTSFKPIIYDRPVAEGGDGSYKFVTATPSSLVISIT